MLIKRIYSLLLILLSSIIVLHATETVSVSDSIRNLLPHLKGQELLQCHSNLCRLAAAEDNADEELACLRAYIAEAHRQENAEEEGHARCMQIMCYYNYNMHDSAILALPINLEFMSKHQLWDHYYNSWDIIVEIYIYQDKLQMALLEAEKMYADARKNKSNYGLGVSAYCMGGIYQTMQRFQEAVKSLEESIEYLSKEEDISLLLSAYNALGEALDGLSNYDNLRTITIEWKAVLDKYKREAEAKGHTPSLNGRYLYCTLAVAIAEIETEHYDKASILLDHAQTLAQGRKQIARYKLLQVQARYFAATKQYEKAIDCNKENIAILTYFGDSISMLTVELQQAEFMLNAGNYKEAALLYKNLIPRKDKLRNSELTTQLDELSTIYEVDKLTLKNKIATNWLYFTLVGSFLLFVIVFLYIIYTIRLRRKNRVLYEAIAQMKKTQNDQFTTRELIPDDKLSGEEILYRKLCKLMQEEKAFLDSQVKREDIAEKLGTNHTYLTDSIKKNTDGQTFTEYLNLYRLRHAATVLAENQSIPINEIGDISGFSSRSTFNRLFRDSYGMSPSEYKAISKEKMIRRD